MSMKRDFVGLMILLISSLVCASLASAVEYTITDLGGICDAQPLTINDNGQGAGEIDCLGEGQIDNFIFGIQHASIWNNGQVTDLGLLGGVSSMASGINNDGKVVGRVSYGELAQTPTSGLQVARGFVWDGGNITYIDTFGGDYSEAVDVNNVGQVAGTAYVSGNETSYAFLYSNGVLANLGTLPGNIDSAAAAINDSGQVVGNATDGDRAHGFIYDNGAMIALDSFLPVKRGVGYPGEKDKFGRAYSLIDRIFDAVAINNLGHVVGTGMTARQTSSATLSCFYGCDAGHAYLFSEGSITDLGTLGGDWSEATSINDHGQVVGSSRTAPGNTARHAFLYENGQIKDLNTLLPTDSGWELEWARTINNKGQILGVGTRNGERRYFLMAPIDADGDGVQDSIQTGTGTFSDTHLPPTSGSIVNTEGLSVSILDSPLPEEGVIVTVGAGTGAATFNVCGFPLDALAGSRVVVTCGSITVNVLEGLARLTLGCANAVVDVPAGSIAKLTQDAGGMCTAVNLGDADITVTANGTTTTISPGEQFVGEPPSYTFSSFGVNVLTIRQRLNTLFLLSNFGLGAGSNGIDPAQDAVTFKIGSFTTTIPAGAFRKGPAGAYAYAGKINDVSIEVLIAPLRGGRFTFQVAAYQVNLNGTTNPVTVELSIGDDHGMTQTIATIR